MNTLIDVYTVIAVIVRYGLHACGWHDPHVNPFGDKYCLICEKPLK